MSKKKRAILQAATVLFANKGFRQTSMVDLSRRAGVAEGTIFYHFKNKEEIFLAVLKEAKNRIDKEVEKINQRAEAVTGRERIEATVSSYLNLSSQMEDVFLMLHRHYPYQIAQRNQECRRLLASIYTRFLDLFEKALVQAKSNGSLSARSNRKTAMVLYAMADGIARFETYSIYNSGALYQELMAVCRQMLSDGMER